MYSKNYLQLLRQISPQVRSDLCVPRVHAKALRRGVQLLLYLEHWLLDRGVDVFDPALDLSDVRWGFVADVV